MAAERSIEVKVGLLILVGVSLLAALVLVMGGVHFGRRFTLMVDFNNPGGLQPGAPVKIAGVRVGTVERMEFRGARVDPATGRASLVRVHAEVEERFRTEIHADAEFFITTQGVLGEQFLAIDPGSAAQPQLRADRPVEGIDPPPAPPAHHRGDVNVRVARVHLREGLGAVGLEPVVELLGEARADLLVGALRLQPPRRDGAEHELEGARVVEVGRDGEVDAGVLHLHRHLAAVVEAGPVHLADRRAREGDVGPLREEPLRRVAELLGDDAADVLRRRGRGGRAEHLEGPLVGAVVLRGDDPVDVAGHLADLRREAAEVAEHLGGVPRRGVVAVAGEHRAGARPNPEAREPREAPEAALRHLLVRHRATPARRTSRGCA